METNSVMLIRCLDIWIFMCDTSICLYVCFGTEDTKLISGVKTCNFILTAGYIALQNVFDYDLFSADDIMGEADIDLQPLITSAIAYGDARMFDDMQIGKWLKSNGNALIDDSIVNIVDGKVKQVISLKLQKENYQNLLLFN